MKIWAIADLHLSFGVPQKSMEFFGAPWMGYTDKLAANWKKEIAPDDLVLIAGDISWALKWEEALVDLQWIDALPGKKVLLRGNHDYWWGSLKKMMKEMPPSIQLIQNNSLTYDNVCIGGARLWDTSEFSFSQYIEYVENPRAKKLHDKEEAIQEDLSDKIFERELIRLKLSLDTMDKKAPIRIAMTHYPPISGTLQPSIASKMLEDHGIQICVFGHLHNLKKNAQLFGEKNGIKYLFTACDYLDFKPLRLL